MGPPTSALGEEFHHNRLSLIASIGGWGTPNRHAPQWDRRRVLDVATRLLYTDCVSVDGLLERTFPFDRAAEAYAWLDEQPQGAVKVVLDTMQTGPAIRTYNIMIGERRRVAAALIAVP